MNLFAKDSEGRISFAQDANKSQDYYCLECGGTLRARSGETRKPHFYHLSPPLQCYQNGKSLSHLNVQLFLQELLPNAKLEVRFPRVGRIADVVWEEKKLIFEVQCSPISSQEVVSRMQDYAHEGFKVIWILHERLYNQRRIHPIETLLRHSPYFFTNFNSEGKGCIYDQIDLHERGFRRKILSKLNLEIDKPIEIVNFTSPIFAHRKKWHTHFEGELLKIIQNPEHEMHKILVETEEKTKPLYWQKILSKFVLKPYKKLFLHFLERASI